MVPLADLCQGKAGLITTLNGGHRFISKLVSLGFTPGAPVTVTRNHGIGPIIVSVRGAQVALGRGEADRILVHPTEEANAFADD